MNLEDMVVSHKRTDTIGFHSREVPRGVRFTETASRVVGARGWGGRYSVGTEFWFGKLRKFQR